MTSELARLAQAAAVAAALTTLQHIWFADDTTLSREARYAMGVAAIGAGFVVACRDPDALAALFAAALGAALPPTIGYEARRRQMRAGRPPWQADR